MSDAYWKEVIKGEGEGEKFEKIFFNLKQPQRFLRNLERILEDDEYFEKVFEVVILIFGSKENSRDVSFLFQQPRNIRKIRLLWAIYAGIVQAIIDKIGPPESNRINKLLGELEVDIEKILQEHSCFQKEIERIILFILKEKVTEVVEMFFLKRIKKNYI